jgi:hypothetical protein
MKHPHIIIFSRPSSQPHIKSDIKMHITSHAMSLTFTSSYMALQGILDLGWKMKDEECIVT